MSRTARPRCRRRPHRKRRPAGTAREEAGCRRRTTPCRPPRSRCAEWRRSRPFGRLPGPAQRTRHTRGRDGAARRQPDDLAPERTTRQSTRQHLPLPIDGLAGRGDTSIRDRPLPPRQHRLRGQASPYEQCTGVRARHDVWPLTFRPPARCRSVCCYRARQQPVTTASEPPWSAPCRCRPAARPPATSAGRRLVADAGCGARRAPRRGPHVEVAGRHAQRAGHRVHVAGAAGCAAMPARRCRTPRSPPAAPPRRGRRRPARSARRAAPSGRAAGAGSAARARRCGRAPAAEAVMWPGTQGARRRRAGRARGTPSSACRGRVPAPGSRRRRSGRLTTSGRARRAVGEWCYRSVAATDLPGDHRCDEPVRRVGRGRARLSAASPGSRSRWRPTAPSRPAGRARRAPGPGRRSSTRSSSCPALGGQRDQQGLHGGADGDGEHGVLGGGARGVGVGVRAVGHHERDDHFGRVVERSGRGRTRRSTASAGLPSPVRSARHACVIASSSAVRRLRVAQPDEPHRPGVVRGRRGERLADGGLESAGSTGSAANRAPSGAAAAPAGGPVPSASAVPSQNRSSSPGAAGRGAVEPSSRDASPRTTATGTAAACP